MTSALPKKSVEIMQRVTTRYHLNEDRLSLTGELASGNCRLWLTARLFRRLLPRLIQWLAEQGAQVPHAEAMQRWAQEQAMAGFVPAPPVVEPGRKAAQAKAARAKSALAADVALGGPDSPESSDSDAALRVWLAESVKLQFEPGRVVLTWPGPEGMPTVRLPLGAEALRQWLHILHSQCELAEWPGLAWPAWLKPLPASAARALQ